MEILLPMALSKWEIVMFRFQNVIGVQICGIALHSGYTAELFYRHPRWACITYIGGV